ncbi:MAG: hypothetical protein KJ800_05440, partial [Proteobacteria bacterium]|nr:hypothetical protein [Pseudomonadota bacterium]
LRKSFKKGMLLEQMALLKIMLLHITDFKQKIFASSRDIRVSVKRYLWPVQVPKGNGKDGKKRKQAL